MTHAIFEREGILVDCTIPDPCEEAVVFKRFDRHVPHSLTTFFKQNEMDKACELLVEGISSPFDRFTFDDIYHSTMKAESWRESDIQPGVMALLSTLQGNHIPMAMISRHASVEALVHAEKYSQLMKYFETTIFRDVFEARRDIEVVSPILLTCERFAEPVAPGRNVVAFVASATLAMDALRAGLFVVWLADPKNHTCNLSFPERLRVVFVSKTEDLNSFVRSSLSR